MNLLNKREIVRAVGSLFFLSLFTLSGCDFVKEQWYEKTGDCEGLATHYALVNEDCQASCEEDNENRPVAIGKCKNSCPKGLEQLKKVAECVEVALKRQQNNVQTAPNQVPPAQNAPQRQAPNNNAPNNYGR